MAKVTKYRINRTIQIKYFSWKLLYKITGADHKIIFNSPDIQIFPLIYPWIFKIFLFTSSLHKEYIYGMRLISRCMYFYFNMIIIKSDMENLIR